MAFRFNLLAHIGRVSSLRERESPPYPQCFEFLGEPVNFEVMISLGTQHTNVRRSMSYHRESVALCGCRWSHSVRSSAPIPICGRAIRCPPICARPSSGTPTRCVRGVGC